MIFKVVLHRTVKYLFNHKRTREVMEREIITFMEDPKNRKKLEAVLEQCIIEYAKNTGYKI